jgi:hypothetical protein
VRHRRLAGAGAAGDPEGQRAHGGGSHGTRNNLGAWCADQKRDGVTIVYRNVSER